MRRYSLVASKRGDLLVALLFLIIFLFIMFTGIHYFRRECSTDSECGPEAYCSSEYKCQKIPVIERTVVYNSYNFIPAALIIGLSIIIGALLLKRMLYVKNSTPESGAEPRFSFYEEILPDEKEAPARSSPSEE